MRDPFIPPKIVQLMRSLHIPDWVAIDAFKTGEQRPGTTKRLKKYASYGTIQITYVKNDKGEYIITWVKSW